MGTSDEWLGTKFELPKQRTVVNKFEYTTVRYVENRKEDREKNILLGETDDLPQAFRNFAAAIRDTADGFPVRVLGKYGDVIIEVMPENYRG